MEVRIFLIAAVLFISFAINGNIEADEINPSSASSGLRASDNYNNLNDLNNVKIYPGNKTGTLHRVFGKGMKIRGLKGIKEKDEKNIIKITGNFISQNKDFLKINPEDLKLKKLASDDENYYINYQQHYKGIPVYESFVGLTIDREGRVLIMGSDFRMGINVSTNPGVHKKELIEIVKDISQKFSKSSEIEILDFSLVIYENHLVWKVVTSSGQGGWIFFVDAHTGELIYYYNAVKNLNGKVTGMIYPKHPLQEQIEVKFPYQFVYVNATRNDSSVFYSNRDNCLNNFMVTKQKINLTNISDANLSFITKYDIEQGWDFAYVEVSANGTDWEQLNGSYMSRYENPDIPLSYGSCEDVTYVPDAPAYTGNSNGWVDETINLNNYLNKTIFLRFRYIEDEMLAKEGIYFDNITIKTNKGIVFYDDAENGSIKWNFSNFTIQDSAAAIFAISNENGSYEFENLNGTLSLTSELKGLWVDVDNNDSEDAKHNFILNSTDTHNWNWNESDTSDRDSESNVYYHVNKIHDYFKKFNYEGMDYQIKVTVEYGTNWCSAEYDSIYENIHLAGAGGGCENLALSSDTIYHEYTHGVVDHIYNLLPYSGESGAMDEAFADYFAATINNDSLVAENIFSEPVRNLNNNLTMDDWQKDVHDDSRILSGALWDLRKQFGAEFTGALVFEAIRITPHAYNFSEFLENLLIADDDNANLWDGTQNKDKICSAFYERKIYSFWCMDLRPDLSVENLTYSPENPNSANVVIISAAIKNLGVDLNLSGVSVSLFVDDIYENSKILNLTNVTETEVNFIWNAIAGTHNITIRIDPQDLINETDETNNELTEILNVWDCDQNRDGIIVYDWNTLMNAYKCFLGINRNCDRINYQEWTNMKKEYQCFVGN